MVRAKEEEVYHYTLVYNIVHKKKKKGKGKHKKRAYTPGGYRELKKKKEKKQNKQNKLGRKKR